MSNDRNTLPLLSVRHRHFLQLSYAESQMMPPLTGTESWSELNKSEAPGNTHSALCSAGRNVTASEEREAPGCEQEREVTERRPLAQYLRSPAPLERADGWGRGLGADEDARLSSELRTNSIFSCLKHVYIGRVCRETSSGGSVDLECYGGDVSLGFPHVTYIFGFKPGIFCI